MSESVLLAPQTLSLENIGPNRTLITLEPFERGFGHTVGNALRRTLLSSLPGCAVVEVKIEGVLHQYATLEGVQEDVLDILLNLREAAFILHGRDEVMLEMSKSEPGPVYTGDIALPHDVEVVNPEHIIAHLTKARDFKMSLKVVRGHGDRSVVYSREVQGVGILYLDAVFNPVRRVHCSVERARVSQRTDLDKLVVDLETNGTIEPKAAIREAARIFQQQMALLLEPEPSDTESTSTEAVAQINPVLLYSVDKLDLTQRAANCLRAEHIYFVGDLVSTHEVQLLRTPNLGKKSLGEIKQALQLHDLYLGMTVPNWPPPDLKYPDPEMPDDPPPFSGA